jgi:hypothetical protein
MDPVISILPAIKTRADVRSESIQLSDIFTDFRAIALQVPVIDATMFKSHAIDEHPADSTRNNQHYARMRSRAPSYFPFS